MAALLRYLPFILTVVLLVAALVDVVRIDPSRVRGLPKTLWAIIVIVVAIVGPIVWFVAGREPLKPRNHGRYRDTPMAPDDDPAFLRKIAHDKEQEARIRDLEKRLADLDKDAESGPDAKPGDSAAGSAGSAGPSGPSGDETPKN